MIQIKIKDGKTFEFEKKNEQYLLDGIPVNVDLRESGSGRFHLIANGRSYEVELVAADEMGKNFKIKAGGSNFEAEAATSLDLLLKRMGLHAGTSAKMNLLKAPMPGLIADVRVGLGEEVTKDTALLVLEAMKMENIIKSHGEGRVKNILVAKGDHVEKGQVLIEFE